MKQKLRAGTVVDYYGRVRWEKCEAVLVEGRARKYCTPAAPNNIKYWLAIDTETGNFIIIFPDSFYNFFWSESMYGA
jgi:hypothetical protein